MRISDWSSDVCSSDLIDPAIRATVRAMPVDEAHAALAREDLRSAARLSPSDTTRVARALEIMRSTGRSVAAWSEARQAGIGDAIRLLPLLLLQPRGWLRDRCDMRFAAMLEQGAIDEVQALLSRHLEPGLRVVGALGE